MEERRGNEAEHTGGNRDAKGHRAGCRAAGCLRRRIDIASKRLSVVGLESRRDNKFLRPIDDRARCGISSWPKCVEGLKVRELRVCQ